MSTPLDLLDIDWSSLDGYTPLEAVMVMKALDEDGEVVLLHCSTKGLRTWDAIGMTIYTSDTLRRSLQEEGE